MTACAIEAPADGDAAADPESGTLAITADGMYGARLAGTGEALFAERWTLGGPEPYAVPLPLGQPEEREAGVLPLSDGRVLIRRRVAERHTFSLLYPTGPATGELPLGAVTADDLVLLPPCPDGARAFALAPGPLSTGVWMVAGGPAGPELLATVPGHCSGGAWLDRAGRMLALDRGMPGGGPVKAVAVDLARGGEVTPLLQITESSNDRLLLADADSGLVLVRSDAPGRGDERLGWGVLGSLRPVRFPESLRLPDAVVTPFAVQPGQVLTPESCAVAVRIDGAGGSWAGVWRPADRRLHQLAPPRGWLAGAGVWDRAGVLQLPYSDVEVACGVARAGCEETFGRKEDPAPGGHRAAGSATDSTQTEPAGGELSGAPRGPVMRKPVPLQQAPLTGRGARG